MAKIIDKNPIKIYMMTVDSLPVCAFSGPMDWTGDWAKSFIHCDAVSCELVDVARKDGVPLIACAVDWRDPTREEVKSFWRAFAVSKTTEATKRGYFNDWSPLNRLIAAGDFYERDDVIA